MARPQKNNADYHSHDKDMRNDPKIKALRRRFKHEGYSIYNMVLELLDDADGFVLKYNDLNVELWAGDFEIEPEKLKEIFDYAIHVGLITLLDNEIFSEGHIKRMTGLLDKRKRKREQFKTPETPKIEVSPVLNPQSKVKKSIVKKTKVKESIKDHDFSQSPFFDFAIFEKEFSGTDYEFCDLKIYYEKIKNWSEGAGKKKKNWIATARNFMLSDKQDGKLILKQGTYVNGANQSQAEFGTEIDDLIAKRYGSKSA